MIVNYIVNHQAEFWLIFGFVMLAVEVLTGFTTGIFLFGGLGAIVSGILMSVGVLPETWVAGIASTGISAGVVTTLLWKPLKRLQENRSSGKDNSSDLIGHEFVLEKSISLTEPGTTHYSGISWKVEIDKNAGVDSMAAGQRVSVSSVDVGSFKVKLAQ